MKRKAKPGAVLDAPPGRPAPRARPRTFTARVQLFAWVAEMAGSREIEISVEQGASAGSVIAKTLRTAGLNENYGIADSVRLAVNLEYVPASHVVNPGDELALIPPVSGGAPAHVRITDEPLDIGAVHNHALTAGSGAVVVFTGVTREVEMLTYEAYMEMAHTCLERIASELLGRYKLEAIAIEHRVGDVPLSEPSVVVAASSAHRPAAFAAAREAIDKIKAEAPIWKLEIESGYRSWVRGEMPNANLS